MNERYVVQSVTLHTREGATEPLWAVVYQSGDHRPFTRYLSRQECADEGIELPRLAVVK